MIQFHFLFLFFLNIFYISKAANCSHLGIPPSLSVRLCFPCSWYQGRQTQVLLLKCGAWHKVGNWINITFCLNFFVILVRNNVAFYCAFLMIHALRIFKRGNCMSKLLERFELIWTRSWKKKKKINRKAVRNRVGAVGWIRKLFREEILKVLIARRNSPPPFLSFLFIVPIWEDRCELNQLW